MSELDTLVHELRTVAGDDGDWVAGPISASVLREAADTIASLRDRLQDADVAYNDAEVLGDVTQGLFRDLMAADLDTAKIWARSWPELLGEKEVDA